ncbi:MAG: PAS domain-containing protein, partial [Dehalococcoidia bacterium]
LGNPSIVLFVDEAVKEMTGYSAGEFVAGEISLRQLIHPEDLERVGAALRRAVRTGEATEVTYSITCRDGSRKTLRDVVRGFPPDETGMPLIEAISFDITESADRERALKEAWFSEHERFEHVAEAAGLVIYDRNMRTNEINWSGPYSEVMGYGPEEIGGQAEWETRVPVDDARRVFAATTDAYREGRIVDVEYRFRRKDGAERWMWLRGIPLMDERGRLVRSIGMVQDVTKRKQLEAQVSSAQRMDTVGALAGGISHDVNNYLTTIIGNLDLAIMRLSENEWPELRDARTAAAGCAELVGSLLTFARQQEGQRIRLSPETVITDASRILGRLAGPNVSVEVSVAPGCPDFDGDRVEIQQVLMNLAVN